MDEKCKKFRFQAFSIRFQPDFDVFVWELVLTFLHFSDPFLIVFDPFVPVFESILAPFFIVFVPFSRRFGLGFGVVCRWLRFVL